MTNDPEVPMNERDAASETQITLHEKLCAYILGEANDDERAEVERALSVSPELRAEREQLEATIGLVRTTMSIGETLSPEVTTDVLSRASAKRPRPWYFSMPMRIAAGIAAITIAYALYESRSEGPMGERVARLDSSANARSDRELADDSSTLAKARQEQAARPSVTPPAVAGELIVAAEPTPSAEPQSTTRSEKDLLAALQPAAKPSASSGNTIDRASGDEDVLEVIDQRAPSGDVSSPEEAARILNENSQHSVPIGVGGASQASAEKKTEAPRDSIDSTSVVSGPSSAGPSSASSSSGGATYHRRLGVREPQARPAGPPAQHQSIAKVGDHYDLGSAGRSASKDKLAYSGTPVLKGLGYTSDDSGESTDGSVGVSQALRGLGYVGDNDEDVKLRALEDSLKEYRPEHHKYQELQEEIERLRSHRDLTPEQRDQLIDQQCRSILERCHRRPDERPRDMYFRFWGDNAFQLALLEPQSTFSVDVDTASYALARRYLNEGHLPERAQVRTEEFVNYFKPDVAAPREGAFAIRTELAPSRFSNDANRTMLRVVVRGREVTKQERKPLALTFVIDCSGSMIEQNRLEMVKHAIRLLLTQLDGNDSIAIVAFSSDARMILPMTSASRRDLIESALFPLKPENSTNSEAGLKMGYEAALAGINPNASNRVVFLSDGVANVGETDPQKLAEGVKRIREKGIYLNSIGVGMNNHNDTLLEQLADKGDGVCNYIDSEDEAKRVMVDNFTGAMETIARDVKIQVEFDPAQVERYRLLGYENRFIANKDFRNDKIDAGEVGAGHQVCALYELELANPSALAAARIDKPGQAGEIAKSSAPDSGPKPLAVVRLRWKAPRDVKRPDANEEATEIEQPVQARAMTSYEGASFGYKRAVVVAQFAEFLRRSSHARGRSFDDLIAEAKNLEKQGGDRDVTELVMLLEKSRSLVLANLPQCDELCQTIDIIRKNQILRAEHDMLSLERDQKTLDELAKQNAELEARLRELLRRKLEARTK